MHQLDLEREFDTDSTAGKPVALSTQCQIIAPGNYFRIILDDACGLRVENVLQFKGTISVKVSFF